MSVDYRDWLRRKGATTRDWLCAELDRHEIVSTDSETIDGLFQRAGLTFPAPGSPAAVEFMSEFLAYCESRWPAPAPPPRKKAKRKPRKARVTEVPPNPQPTPEIKISDVSASSLELAE